MRRETEKRREFKTKLSLKYDGAEKKQGGSAMCVRTKNADHAHPHKCLPNE